MIIYCKEKIFLILNRKKLSDEQKRKGDNSFAYISVQHAKISNGQNINIGEYQWIIYR